MVCGRSIPKSSEAKNTQYYDELWRLFFTRRKCFRINPSIPGGNRHPFSWLPGETSLGTEDTGDDHSRRGSVKACSSCGHRLASYILPVVVLVLGESRSLLGGVYRFSTPVRNESIMDIISTSVGTYLHQISDDDDTFMLTLQLLGST